MLQNMNQNSLWDWIVLLSMEICIDWNSLLKQERIWIWLIIVDGQLWYLLDAIAYIYAHAAYFLLTMTVFCPRIFLFTTDNDDRICP